MSIQINVSRTGFYKELEEKKEVDKINKFFQLTRKKFLPNIDNIYYTVRIKDDYNKNPAFDSMFELINELKEKVSQQNEIAKFNDNLNVDYKTFKLYKYCLTCEDLYDVFIMEYLPNNNTPRIVVQIRSNGLWNRSNDVWQYGYEYMLNTSFIAVRDMLDDYGLTIERIYENRIDYCYHTNALQNPDKVFSEKELEISLRTTLTKGYSVFTITSNDKKNTFTKDYFALGVRQSNNLFVRFYNKVTEVIEQGYKDYFIKIWFENGLINYYDKFCFEYAIKHRNYNHVYKAQMEFYLIHGKDEKKKAEYKKALEDKNNTLEDIKKLVYKHMPKNTAIFNIEFETKRRFYRTCDNYIDTFKLNEDANIVDSRLNRIFKIIHNRDKFLNYLTETTVSFVDCKGNYTDWWKRLRTVKMSDIVKNDSELLRDYSKELNLELLQRKFINLVTTMSVYEGKEYSDGFAKDALSAISNINDNDKLAYSLYKYKDNRDIKKDKLKNRL